MTRKREVRIQTALLLILLPTLFLTAAGAAYLMYSSLYREILAGFDARLRAVSTITGAFIDGDEHADILQPHQPRALAADPDGQGIFALDASGALLRLDSQTGSAAVLGRLSSRFDDLTWDERNGRLVGLEHETGWLFEIDPETVTTKPLGRIPSGTVAIAGDSASGRFYAAGTALFEIEPRAFKSSRLRELEDLPIRSLATGPGGGTLFALTDSLPSKLVEVRLPDGSIEEVAPVVAAESEGGADSEISPSGGVKSSSQPLISGITYDRRNGVLWAAGERLGRLNPDDGLFGEVGYPGYRNENGAIYQSYVLPMRRIKEAVGLTYLYTFVLGDEDREIVYVLDANQDDAHSRIGDIDADPPEAGTVRVRREGGVNLSEIEFWEQWGLIKSADAPIFRENGDISALAGADINVSIIEEKTRSALVTVLLTGLFCVLIASVAVVRVSNSLLRPIEELKGQALKVAAGDFGQEVRIDRPAELKELSDSFNDMSAALKGTIDGLTRSNQELERERQRAELILTVASRTDAATPDEFRNVLCGRTNRGAVRRDASGWIVRGRYLYFWFVSDSPEDPFEAVRLRSDLSSLLSSLVDRKQDSWEEIREFLDPLFCGVLGALLRLDMDHLVLRGLIRDHLPAFVSPESEGVRLLKLEGDLRREAGPGEQFFISRSKLIEDSSGFKQALSTGRLRDPGEIQGALDHFGGLGKVSRIDDLWVSFWRES